MWTIHLLILLVVNMYSASRVSTEIGISLQTKLSEDTSIATKTVRACWYSHGYWIVGTHMVVNPEIFWKMLKQRLDPLSRPRLLSFR